MGRKKNILFITTTQFGYHMGLFFHSKYLNKTHKVSFVCWDNGLNKKEIEGTTILYVSRKGNRFIRFSRFLKVCLFASQKNDIIYFKYFSFCSFVKLYLQFFVNNKKWILDIRSGNVSNNILIRLLNDAIIKLDSLFFRNILIISNGLRNKLSLKENNCHILPLGADDNSDYFTTKNFEELRLLYVGKFYTRNIEQSIEGFANFVNKYGNEINITYDIIGFGSVHEEDLIWDTIQRFNLTDIVKFHGKIYYPELNSFFQKCNIGISYVPITPYYQFQPPTKTFEYLMNGMAVIATSTVANSEILSTQNGILINDSAQDFCEGLEMIYRNRGKYCSIKIRDNIKNFSWENLTNHNLVPYLDSL